MKADEDIQALIDKHKDPAAVRLAIIQGHHFMDQTIDAKFAIMERLLQECQEQS